MTRNDKKMVDGFVASNMFNKDIGIKLKWKSRKIMFRLPYDKSNHVAEFTGNNAEDAIDSIKNVINDALDTMINYLEENKI